jgi:hypothetical protein
VGFAAYKVYNHYQIASFASFNYTILLSYRNALNATHLAAVGLTAVQNQSLALAISSLMAVERVYVLYYQNLVASTYRIGIIYNEIVWLNNRFCSCTGTTTTTLTATTTTTSATTTTSNL